MLGWGYAQNTQILLRAKDIVQKPAFLSFLSITIAIAVCQIQTILILIPLENQHVGMGICAKHTNSIKSKRYCSKTSIFVVFVYNNCSVSNPNDFFNTHTTWKSTCWDKDMRKTYKFYSERKIFLKKHSFLSFLAITIDVRQTEVLLILIPLENQHVGMGICAKHSNSFKSKRYCSK